MPGRSIPLITGEIYHIFNRGNNKQNIFLQPRDYKRFTQTFHYYQFSKIPQRFSTFSKNKLPAFSIDNHEKLVEIMCYCLMPNHFHFMIKQIKDNGISIFMSQVGNSYTRYFNTKYNYIGSLFQGTFKSVLVENEEQFLHLSRYIHLNPIVSEIATDLDSYLWSSYHEYMNNANFIYTQEVLNFFPSPKEYRGFLLDQIDYAKSLEFIKHKTIDEDF